MVSCKKHFKKHLYIFTVFFTLIALSSCSLPTKIIGTFPEPEESVTGFFESVCTGDFEKSDTYLDGLSLVVKNQDEDVFSKALCKYLLESYHYELVGDLHKEQFSAEGKVSFTYLDFNLLINDLKSGSTKLGKRIMAEGKEGYVKQDDNGITLTDDGAKKIAAEVLDSLMSSKPERYYSTKTFDIQLKFNGKKWLVYIPDELFEVISGKYETAG